MERAGPGVEPDWTLAAAFRVAGPSAGVRVASGAVTAVQLGRLTVWNT